MADDAPEQLPLLPEEPAAFMLAEVGLADLPPDDRLLGPPPDSALVASVRRQGLLQPVLLVQQPGGYRVADGRRRIKAARAAQLARVPAWVTDGDGSLAAALGLVTHGTRRENPVAELYAIEHLLALGADDATIARETGLRLVTVRQRLRLHQLARPLRTAVASGRLAVGVAEAAAKLPEAAQQRLVAKLAAEGKLTSTDVDDERRVRTVAAADTLPFATLAGTPAADLPSRDAATAAGAPPTTAVADALRQAGPAHVQEVVVAGDETLLVLLADGRGCTLHVQAGVQQLAAYAR